LFGHGDLPHQKEYPSRNRGNPDDAEEDDCPFFGEQLHKALDLAEVPDGFGLGVGDVQREDAVKDERVRDDGECVDEFLLKYLLK
jgi:hypothetical protein